MHFKKITSFTPTEYRKNVPVYKVVCFIVDNQCLIWLGHLVPIDKTEHIR
jgi:hypothetical protein